MRVYLQFVLESRARRNHVGEADHYSKRGAMYRYNAARPEVLDHKRQPHDGPTWPVRVGTFEERRRPMLAEASTTTSTQKVQMGLVLSNFERYEMKTSHRTTRRS